MSTFELKKKRMLISIVRDGDKVDHPFYVEKSILRQLWDLYLKSLLWLLIGLGIGMVIR